MEAPLMRQPPQLIDLVILAKANSELDAAEKALHEHDREAAVQKFTRIAPDANKDRAFAARSKRLSEEIGKAADQMLAEVDPMIDAKQYLPAAARLSSLAQMFKGLPQEQEIGRAS